MGEFSLLKELYGNVKAAESWTGKEREQRVEKLKREGRIQ